MSKEIESHILELFEVKTFLGSGAYGHVWRVTERSSGREYALKKIFDAFQNEVDAQRTYREISILPQLEHDNIVRLQSVVRARNSRDLYLLFESVETDLHSILGYPCGHSASTSSAPPTCASWPTSSPACSSTCTRRSSSTATSSPATSSSTPTAKVDLLPPSQTLRLRTRQEPHPRGALAPRALRGCRHAVVSVAGAAAGRAELREAHRSVECGLHSGRTCHWGAHLSR